jgi:hypothetical protein
MSGPCANCDKADTQAKNDFLCKRCRRVEDIIVEGEFPETKRLEELQQGDGIVIQRFLNWIHASEYEICSREYHSSSMSEHTYYLPTRTYGDDKKLMQEYAGIDEDELDLELEALYQVLKRQNASSGS